MSKSKLSSPYTDLNRHPMFLRTVTNPLPADNKTVPGERELVLVLPFGQADKPDKIKPVYRTLVGADGYLHGFWDCPHCGMEYVRRRSCQGHMGMIPNVASGCAGKRVDRS